MQDLIDNELWQAYQQVWFRPWGALPPAPSGAIISLWNPNGVKQTLAKNRQYQHLLSPALERKGYKMLPIWGASADLSYREFSMLITCSEKTAARLAALCAQKAYYFVDNEQVRLCNTHCPQQRVQLDASFRSRLTYAALPRHNDAIQSPG
ncbi:DUF3293 domain-containing protein [Pseudoalteromonas sp. OOF1S-7]|uniref:DUF3293 domain-containing protein n=1 Tax=Pseudoalteromonas sp. OOF1S-7 TaxID=2917757 RepID=UPI001EF6AA84|nr:DUF3293 domain-containing protein [Pseudoalteromonas sp. OOF1S-7]MCG7536663.1 DUF3293 domain-containing protein [Pseudoalteromonas sp. OOF1S-7]